MRAAVPMTDAPADFFELMPDVTSQQNDSFLDRVNSAIEANLADEQFGVSELADALNMSRSNLLRKVKSETKLSVSQLIRQVRLKKAMELLRKSSINVSEAALQVGFGSTSYFIKCFREYYGYSPGQVGNREEPPTEAQAPRARIRAGWWAAGLVMCAALAAIIVFAWPARGSAVVDKSIAVLPFKNDSGDSTNVYFINGLMEATLNKLQRIKDLKVISRTSVEKYRDAPKSIPEMGEELNVSYFVEGSGQKIGDRILLNIQLIDAATDKHLWGKQYRRELKDIFALQEEVARNIAEEISVIITPDEEAQMVKRPTANLEAYDAFLKGNELLNHGGKDNLDSAIVHFKQAIALDNSFALAYACIAIDYYYQDIYMKEQRYEDEIGYYADKALLYDEKLPEGLFAKGMYYIHKREKASAVPYLEKALEYNPNNAVVINFLADFYTNHMPNTEKYLEYALKGVRLGAGKADSVSLSYSYLHLANALVQTGFVDEALRFVDKSIAYFPQNYYAHYVKAFIRMAKDRDYSRTIRLLKIELKKDTSRIDITQDIAKVYFLKRDYDSSLIYYKKFVYLRDLFKLDVYQHEGIRIAFVYEKAGLHKEAAEFLKTFKEFADQDKSIFKDATLSGYYAYTGDRQKAIEHLRLFSEEENYQFWVLLMDDDPSFDSISDMPEFKELYKKIQDKFWKEHDELKATLEEQGLL